MLKSVKKCWPRFFFALTTAIRVRIAHIFIDYSSKNFLCRTIPYFCARQIYKSIFINDLVLKKKILNIFKYTIFTALGITMFWLVYREQDFGKIWETLKNEVNYWWVLLALVFGLLSHISRTLRWKIALEPLNEHPSTANSFMAIMIAYFMNLLLPRMGEFVRCGILSKYEKISFTKLLGTVLSERIIDLIIIISLCVTVFFLEMDKVSAFIDENPGVFNGIKNVLTSPYLWISVVLIVAAFVFYLIYSKRKGKKNKLEQFIDGFIDGLKAIFAMKRYKAYIAHSLFIWFMYFMMMYVSFFSFEFTKGLGPVAGLTTFVFSSLGMLMPVQGGIGAWHFMAEKALGLYGVTSANGKIFALLVHSSPNIMIIVLGLLCFIALPIVNRDKGLKK